MVSVQAIQVAEHAGATRLDSDWYSGVRWQIPNVELDFQDQNITDYINDTSVAIFVLNIQIEQGAIGVELNDARVQYCAENLMPWCWNR